MTKLLTTLRWALLASFVAIQVWPIRAPAADRIARDQPFGRPRTLAPLSRGVARIDEGVRVERLPPVVRPVERASFHQPLGNEAWPVRRTSANIPEDVPPPASGEPLGFGIDLPTVLRLADANNLQVAFARQQVVQALARLDAAEALWLPSLRGGLNYNRHEGAIQAVAGNQFNTSRGAFYAGAGAGGFGAGSPMVPGIFANFSLADALFLPLAARQFAQSRGQAAAAATNDTLLQVSLGYFELLRCGEEVAIAESILADAERLAELTSAYAQTGAGLPSDANRALTEVAIRRNDVQRAHEARRVASARLAQLLRLDPTAQLLPAEETVAPLEIVSPEISTKELVAQGLSQRPELAESRFLVGEAVERLRRERLAVFLPSVLLGASYGGMGAGINEVLAAFHDRLDVDALAYWELRNFGFGEAAARRGAQSAVASSQLRQMAVMDHIAREVAEAHVQVQSRKSQMAIARAGIVAATASHEENLERIEEGKGLPIEVLQSIQALAQIRREYLRTVIDYNIAQFTLYRALGWPVKLPAEFLPTGG